jgi:hypothetical protein
LILEALPQVGSDSDDETFGILAGVYKRLHTLEDHVPSWESLAHEMYAEGWRRSEEENAYLGLNTASTALFLGKDQETFDLAFKVKKLVETSVVKPQAHVSYWDQVTLAEALLLLPTPDLTRAAELYRDAFAKASELSGHVATTKEQARRILTKRGLADKCNDILGEPGA